MLALAPNNTSHISQKQAGDATWRLIHFSLAGLVVDYSAHIAHMFMKTAGTNRQRAARAVTEMGPPPRPPSPPPPPAPTSSGPVS